MSNYNTISNALTTGSIIAIVIGSVLGLATLIGIIITIVCIVKAINRSNNVRSQGMILQPPQPYPQSWPNQYPLNTMSVANYPPAYTASAPNYVQPSSM
jgi:hypothetical protein